MTDRLNEIFSSIPSCNFFADIGCDHGYISLEMIKSGKCNVVYASDISEKCLEKAKKNLFEYIKRGKAFTVVSNGFDNLKKCDCALISGMGGEEICDIIKRCVNLPDILVLQPMKNSQKVRTKLINCEYFIEKDYTFFAEEKFYDLIVARKGIDCLTDDETEFGRTNILTLPKAFTDKLKIRRDMIDKIISSGKVNEKTVNEMKIERERINKYVKP